MTQSNRRQYFRLSIFSPCTMTAITVADRPLDMEPVAGHLYNVSAGGCLVQVDLDLPIRLPFICQLEFSLRGQPFRLLAVPVRKVDDRRTYQYAMRFRDLKDMEEARLVRELLALEVERRQ